MLDAEKVQTKESKPRQKRVFKEAVQEEPAGTGDKAQSASKNAKKKKEVTRKRYEKPDIEKLRQSRYERRAQRQERNQAQAIEQV